MDSGWKSKILSQKEKRGGPSKVRALSPLTAVLLRFGLTAKKHCQQADSDACDREFYHRTWLRSSDWIVAAFAFAFAFRLCTCSDHKHERKKNYRRDLAHA